MRYSKVDQAMRTAAKPRIRYIRKYGIYRCTGHSIETVGISPAQAYSAWETCNEARKGIAQSRKSFGQTLKERTPEEATVIQEMSRHLMHILVASGQMERLDSQIEFLIGGRP